MNGGDQRLGGRVALRSLESSGGRHSYHPGDFGAGDMGSGRERATSQHRSTEWSVSLELTVKRDGTTALIRTHGYINREGGIQISKLAQRLAVKGARRIELDLSGSPLLNVPALETLLKAKRILADRGVPFTMVGAVPAVAKVLQLMKVAEDARKEARQ